MLTDDENDDDAVELLRDSAKKKYKDPTDMKDAESWQEGKEELMVLLQQVCLIGNNMIAMSPILHCECRVTHPR